MFDRLKQIEVMREGYEKNGWALCHQLFPKEVAQATLYKFQTALGGDKDGYKGIWGKGPFTEHDCFESYAYHFDPHAILLWTMTPYMQALTGKELLPTTSYFRVYRKGDICKLHADRFAAEHAITLTLGYSDDINWPLWISEEAFEARVDGESQVSYIPDGTKLSFLKLPMEPGDAVIYKGLNHIHGRHDPNPNEWSAHIFLNFVDRNGPYAEHAFDQRQDTVLGTPEFHFPEKA